LAFMGSDQALSLVEALVPQINYFGKRGSFFQLLGPPCRVEALPQEFIVLDGVQVNGTHVTGTVPRGFSLGLVQMLDDWGEELTFDAVNVYKDVRIQLGKERIRKSVVLPYRLVHSSRSFSYYEQM